MSLRLSKIGHVETGAEPVELRCDRIRSFEESGDYESALDAFGDLWKGIGYQPKTEGLSKPLRAEVLLRAGILTSSMGEAKQIEGSQELAKDLITESARVFENLGLTDKAAEAQIDLALCYLREGGIDEARVTLRQVLERLGDQESEQTLRALLNSAVIEKRATRYEDALRIHTEAAPLFALSQNHALRGKFHNEFATVLKNLALAEGRGDYIDRAFIEYAAASYHLERAGHARYLARVENNLGLLFLNSGKLIEAHQHLNRARALFVKLKDKGSVAQVDDTRARAFLAEGHNQKAEMIVSSAVRTLGEGDEHDLLAEALTTHGTALARLGRYQRALAELKRAMEVSQQAGHPQTAGLAALTITEELAEHLRPADLRGYYKSAEGLLAQSQDSGIHARLGRCARKILETEDASQDETSAPGSLAVAGNGSGGVASQEVALDSASPWAGCSLEEEVLRYEGALIKRALEASGGSVTRAARMLDCTHQGLAFILNGRHKSLLKARTPVRPRRRSILRRR